MASNLGGWRVWVTWMCICLSTAGWQASGLPGTACTKDHGISCKQGRRVQMEDRVCVLPVHTCDSLGMIQHSMYGIFDGHNGSWVAHALAQQLLPSLATTACTPISCDPHSDHTSHPNQTDPVTIAEMLRQQFAATDEQLRGLFHLQYTDTLDPASYKAPPASSHAHHHPLRDAGSTALVAWLVQQGVQQDMTPVNIMSSDVSHDGSLMNKEGHTQNQATGNTQTDADAATLQSTPAMVKTTVVVAGVGNSRALVCRQSTTTVAEVVGDGSQVPNGDANAPGPKEGAAVDPGVMGGDARRHAALMRAQRRRQQQQGSAQPVPHAAKATAVASVGGWPVSEVVMLSSLHEASNETEAKRVIEAGGTISPGVQGVTPPRLGGDLEITRAFGDVSYRSKGLTVEPDVMAREVEPGDLLLVLATDGVFEALTPQSVCDHALSELLQYPGGGISRASPAPQPIALGGNQWDGMTATRGVDDDEGDGNDGVGVRGGRDNKGFAHGGGIDEGKEGVSKCDEGEVLASDCHTLVTRGPLWRVAHRLVEEAYNRMSGDNLAVVVVDLRQPTPTTSQPATSAEQPYSSDAESASHSVQGEVEGLTPGGTQGRDDDGEGVYLSHPLDAGTGVCPDDGGMGGADAGVHSGVSLHSPPFSSGLQLGVPSPLPATETVMLTPSATAGLASVAVTSIMHVEAGQEGEMDGSWAMQDTGEDEGVQGAKRIPLRREGAGDSIPTDAEGGDDADGFAPAVPDWLPDCQVMTVDVAGDTETGMPTTTTTELVRASGHHSWSSQNDGPRNIAGGWLGVVQEWLRGLWATVLRYMSWYMSHVLFWTSHEQWLPLNSVNGGYSVMRGGRRVTRTDPHHPHQQAIAPGVMLMCPAVHAVHAVHDGDDDGGGHGHGGGDDTEHGGGHGDGPNVRVGEGTCRVDDDAGGGGGGSGGGSDGGGSQYELRGLLMNTPRLVSEEGHTHLHQGAGGVAPQLHMLAGRQALQLPAGGEGEGNQGAMGDHTRVLLGGEELDPDVVVDSVDVAETWGLLEMHGLTLSDHVASHLSHNVHVGLDEKGDIVEVDRHMGPGLLVVDPQPAVHDDHHVNVKRTSQQQQQGEEPRGDVGIDVRQPATDTERVKQRCVSTGVDEVDGGGTHDGEGEVWTDHLLSGVANMDNVPHSVDSVPHSVGSVPHPVGMPDDGGLMGMGSKGVDPAHTLDRAHTLGHLDLGVTTAHLGHLGGGPGGVMHADVLSVGSRMGRGLMMAHEGVMHGEMHRGGIHDPQQHLDSDSLPDHTYSAIQMRPDPHGLVMDLMTLPKVPPPELAWGSMQQEGDWEGGERHGGRGKGVGEGKELERATGARGEMVREEGAGEGVGPGGSRWRLDSRFAAGHFGEVWRAVRRFPPSSGAASGQAQGRGRGQGKGRLFPCDHYEGRGGGPRDEEVVIKRVFAERGEALYESGLREAYFGALMLPHQEAACGGHAGENLGFNHLVPFIEAFSTPRASPSPSPPSDSSSGPCHDSTTHTSHSSSHTSSSKHPRPPTPGQGANQRSGASGGRCPSPPRDLWLVFRSAGRSLHDLMYEPVSHGSQREGGPQGEGGAQGQGPHGFSVLGPSRWWWIFRRHSVNGRGPMREVIRQLITAVDALQELNITHRDIKVDNMLLKDVRGGVPRGDDEGEDMEYHLSLIDFGSALDEGTLSSGLWGRQGPSDAQTTAEYAPPEALFASYWEGTRAVRPRMWAYDMWSIGVVWLEMLLGTPDVWALPPATHSMMVKRLIRLPPADRATALLLRGLMQWCISPPAPRRDRKQGGGPKGSTRGATGTGRTMMQGPSAGLRGGSGPAGVGGHTSPGVTGSDHVIPGGEETTGRGEPSGRGGVGESVTSSASSRDVMVPWECTDGAVLELIKARDPTGAGLGDNVHAVQLLRSLLQWSPEARPTAKQVLSHQYFNT